MVIIIVLFFFIPLDQKLNLNSMKIYVKSMIIVYIEMPEKGKSILKYNTKKNLRKFRLIFTLTQSL